MGNLAMYATKGFEYLLILGFLALFTIFYLYFTSNRFEKVTAAVSSTFDHLVDWFRVPDNILFHQGHAWVHIEESQPGIVKVDMDDFAQKMAGPMGIGITLLLALSLNREKEAGACKTERSLLTCCLRSAVKSLRLIQPGWLN
jgi:hypothetical protein